LPSVDRALDMYQDAQVLLLKDCADTSTWGIDNLRDVYKSLAERTEEKRDVWCVENGIDQPEDPALLLRPCEKEAEQWYGSFIVNLDKATAKEKNIIDSLPLENFELPLAKSEGSEQLDYSNTLWFFIGRNQLKEPICGRKLHTDDVPQNGTWHLQVSGRKTWCIKPTEELKKKIKVPVEEEVRIECNRGDILLINTRLWWHRTEINSTNDASDNVCVSIARDLFIGKKPDGPSDMTNIDGFYAAEDMDADTVVVRESALPDVELPRSSSANCKVVEIPVESGGDETEHAIVTCRPIKAGEWFTIPDSDSDSDPETSEDEDAFNNALDISLHVV